jgi:hypothetical protein
MGSQSWTLMRSLQAHNRLVDLGPEEMSLTSRAFGEGDGGQAVSVELE